MSLKNVCRISNALHLLRCKKKHGGLDSDKEGTGILLFYSEFSDKKYVRNIVKRCFTGGGIKMIARWTD